MPLAFLREGLLPDSEVFRALVTATGPLSVRQLMDRLHLHRKTTADALDRLSRQQLVQWKPTPRLGMGSPAGYWSPVESG